MVKINFCKGSVNVIAMGVFLYFVLTVGFFFGGDTFAEDETLPIKGVLIASGKGGEKIKSSWGELDSRQLLLNAHQRISLSGNNLKIIFGLVHWDTKSASHIDNDLKFSSQYVAKSPVSVKLFQEDGSGKWCATDGILGISNDKYMVFEGLKLSIIGGADNPVKIAGTAFADTTIIIKDGKTLKSD
jgi:hypothetical protein